MSPIPYFEIKINAAPVMYYAKNKYCLSEQAMKATSNFKEPRTRRGSRGKEANATPPADVVNGNWRIS